ncbi:MAG: AAA family ATPase [Hyphomicrobiales bacterium]|nr:AAA family ATPase [Hyphomicrobiales bacterium]MDE2283045.1 AAA family ATPase [Hyphomicrobiales bacterium]
MTATTASQDEVFAFLADPATHGGQKVQRIDTHAASVFLAGERVFKIKRAVRFPFLDYSTLALRKQACEAEIAVNVPYAPQIYCRAAPITRERDGKLAIAGAGEPVEWAVEMRRFDEKRTLDHLAGQIDTTLAEALGRAVAAAHANTRPIDPQPWIAALGAYIDEHAEAFREYPDIFPASDATALIEASRSAYHRILPLLRERGRQGFIRRIHGDLHLGNIVLIDNAPVLFDAIEFSDLIASGDVLYDLAFLLMDLLERGLAPQANTVLNRYLTQTRRTEDLDALAALPLFLSLRAAIRAKVTAARMERAAAREKAAIGKSARAYFDFARWAIRPTAPKFIAVGGLSGTGKSKLARDLAPLVAPMPGAVVLRSDVERKTLLGVGETDKLPPDAYTPQTDERVYRLLAANAARVFKAGHSVIVDAVFARAGERTHLADSAKAVGASVCGLFLTASLEVRLARIGGRRHDASDADAAIARAQEGYDIGAIDWTCVDASGAPEATLSRVEAILAALD